MGALLKLVSAFLFNLQSWLIVLLKLQSEYPIVHKNISGLVNMESILFVRIRLCYPDGREENTRCKHLLWKPRELWFSQYVNDSFCRRRQNGDANKSVVCSEQISISLSISLPTTTHTCNYIACGWVPSIPLSFEMASHNKTILLGVPFQPPSIGQALSLMCFYRL